MNESFQNKTEKVKEYFLAAPSSEGKYKILIEMGRRLPPLPDACKIPKNLVQGCQSSLYLHSSFADEKVYFAAASDALISAGLAALLISVYSEEPPETILKQPPSFLAELGLYSSLSPNRSNGLSQIHLRMKQEALSWLIAANRTPPS